MFSKIISAALFGIDAYVLEVEVDISIGNLGQSVIVGLPDTAVKESKERVKAAIKNSGYYLPERKVTMNLAPADMKKEGPAYDLPIAIGILDSTGQIDSDMLEEYAIVGELALDGTVRPVKGVLSMAMKLVEQRLKGIILPYENAAEAAVISDLEVKPIRNLQEAVGYLNGYIEIEPLEVRVDSILDSYSEYDVDFSEVKGQELVKRALTVAAAGGHNILMIGPPGSGKTMLARRIPTILPNLSIEESLETTRVHSVVKHLGEGVSLILNRPFRSPHHTVSEPGLVGGGSYPRPGEVSLAHNGVLFLDELPEFNRRTLEVLRQPLEDGEITIGRASTSITYPAKVMLICAMNPCPCGYYSDPNKNCNCSPFKVEGYRSKISGPLLDRIDIHIEVPAVQFKEVSSDAKALSSEEMRKDVVRAQKIQRERFKEEKIFTNSKMNNRLVRKYCKIDRASKEILRSAMEELGLSARAYIRVLKLARTIADIEGSPEIRAEHLSESIQYRSLDRDIVM